jgi:hypothetical protein
MTESQPASDSSYELQERSLRRRLARRRTLLELLGIALIVAGLVVNWPPSDDASIPATRPFLVLLGVLTFAAGLALEHRSAGAEGTRSGDI